jgi:hypothetical protein
MEIVHEKQGNKHISNLSKDIKGSFHFTNLEIFENCRDLYAAFSVESMRL